MLTLKKIIERYLFISIFFLSIFIFLAHTVFTKTAIFADGRFYFAYTRSLVFDHDINLVNEFKALSIKPDVNNRGLAVSPYPPGASILWAFPYWMINNAIDVINPLFQANFEVRGFEFVYQLIAALTSTFLGTFGLYLTYLIINKYFAKRVALLCVAVLFLTTNLLFYIAVEPINSHAASFFISSLFVYFLLEKVKSNRTKYYIFIGALAGFAGTTRTQDSLIGILPLISIIISGAKQVFKKWLSLFLGLIIGLLPQIVLWKAFYNIYFTGPTWGYGFTFSYPHIIHVLFNPQNGLFTITPVVLISFLGLFLLRKKDKAVFFYALFYFLLQLYMVSSWKEYFQGGSFSIRMLITTYPLLSFGLASVIEKSLSKFGSSITFLAILSFGILNSVLIIRYLLIF